MRKVSSMCALLQRTIRIETLLVPASSYHSRSTCSTMVWQRVRYFACSVHHLDVTMLDISAHLIKSLSTTAEELIYTD